MELSEFKEAINYLIQNEDLKFSCFKTSVEEKDFITLVGLDLNENYDGEYYPYLDFDLASRLKEGESLVIINDFTEREKLHYDNISIDIQKPYFSPINIVGSIDGSNLRFEPNSESIIPIEKPLQLTFKK